jgi:hypothetical protein
MAEVVDAGRLGPVEHDAGVQQELEAIRAELARIGLAMPGSLVTRLSPCGKPNCACKANPPRLHGPYISWTRKVNAKTVTRLLTAEQADEYRDYIDNDRRLRGLLHELEALTLGVVEADPRWRR